MGVISETELRTQITRAKKREVCIKKGDIITPSARDYIKDQNIKIIYTDENQKTQKKQIAYKPMAWRTSSAPSAEGFTDTEGKHYEEKPEFMTHLLGRRLVLKNHSRIVFRGKMDSLQALILETQTVACGEGFLKIAEDLEEILAKAREILAAEVREINIPSKKLLGYSEEEIRKASHNPMEYFGIGHFLVSYQMGTVMTSLNILRTHTREAELAAVSATDFENPDIKSEIIRALNRLSSAIYILMCRFLSGYYE